MPKLLDDGSALFADDKEKHSKTKLMKIFT